ncbi:MAG: hypothetical protein E7386_00880 [Ruminococcaceae bacterium]|nr:hypothetical protein [Oscillospiraceae bacterium]
MSEEPVKITKETEVKGKKSTAGSVIKLILLYLVIYLVCSAMFVGLFHTGLLKNMNVLMYKGIIFVVLTGLVAAIVMGVVRKFWKFVTVRDIIMMFVIFCCVNTVIFTLVPVTVERSVSVFMLSYMDENSDKTFTQDSVGEVFTSKYVNDYGAFEKRFNEQIVTGTIKQNADGTYSITDRGRLIVKGFRTCAEWFDTDRRLVYPNEH